MVIKLFKTGLFILTASVLMSSSCNKDGTIPCHGGSYAFSATSQWSPERGVYHTGDTLFLTSTLSKQQTDLINPTIVMDYSNSVGIGGVIGTVTYDTTTHQPLPARFLFQIFSVAGEVVETSGVPENGINFYYQEGPANYTCTLGFVCKAKGVFTFGVSDLKSMGLRGKNCTNAGFSMNVTNTDKHIALFQAATQLVPDAYSLRQMYCFRVQ